MKLASPTTLLAALNAAVLLGGGFVSYLTLWHESEANLAPLTPGKAVQVAAPKWAHIDDDAILSKPIFRRSRRALGVDDAASVAKAANKPSVPPPMPPSPVLVGVLRGTSGQNWVLLEGGGGATRRLLPPGGDFEGWRVVRVGAKDATLHHRDVKVDIQIRLANSSADTPKNTK